MLVPNRDIQWFQQDSAAPHVAKDSLRWLREHFGERLISRSTVHPWSACSPDLTPLDFHLWGYLKDSIQNEHFDNLNELRETLCERVREILPLQCENVIKHALKRFQICIDRKGGHLEQVF